MFQYTNRGLGTKPPRVRFNCRPEITVFTLKAVPFEGKIQPDFNFRRIAVLSAPACSEQLQKNSGSQDFC